MEIETKYILTLLLIALVAVAAMLSPIFLSTSTCSFCHKKVAPLNTSVITGMGSRATLCRDCSDVIIHYIHSCSKEEPANE